MAPDFNAPLDEFKEYMEEATPRMLQKVGDE